MNLDNYKTISQHSNDMLQIKNQITDIYNLNDDFSNSLETCIKYSDCGKVIENIEDFENLTDVLSASIKCLEDKEKIAILTKNQTLRDSLCYIGNIYYEPALKEMSEKLELEVEDIRTLIRQISRPSSKVTKDLDCILIKGYLKYCEELASLNIKEIETGFSAIDTYKLDNYSFIQNEVLQLKNKEDLIIVSSKNEDRTTASLLFSDLVQNENKSRRIYYLLPLIKSINTLYKELLDKNIESGIVHSQAEDFLSELQSDKDIKHLYESFKRSTKQLTLCTFERVIRSVFSYKDYEMLLAQFKNSIFIVDEVHYFDTENTAKLLTVLKFLKEKLNISICIMSSCMSEELKEVICSDLNINNIIIDEDSKSDIEKIHFDSDEYSKVSEGINKVISICRVATYKSY